MQHHDPGDPAEQPSSPPESLSDLIERADGAARGEEVRFRTLIEAMGPSSLHAVLLLPAILVASPLSGIPGLSGTGGVLIAIVSAQIVIGRDRLWLPQWILERKLPTGPLHKALGWLRRPAALVDKAVHPRAQFLSSGMIRRFLGLVCMLLGLMMPVLEFLPFTSSIAAAVVAVIALSLLARDRLVATAVTGLLLLVAVGFLWPR